MTNEWFVGFADGEGCFRLELTFRKEPPGQRSLSIGFEINQSLRDAAVLERLRDFLGFGTVYYNAGGGRLACWRVYRQDDNEALVRLFDKHKLQSAKREDYLIWREAVLLRRKFHRSNHEPEQNEAVWATMDSLIAALRVLRDGRRAAARRVVESSP